MYKIIIVILLAILLSTVAFDFYTVSQTGQKAPLPTPAPLPSIEPTKDNPREMKKEEKIEYKTAGVEIRNFTAVPNSLKIKTYTLVTWTNYDKDPHQILGEKWESMVMKEKETFSQAFEKPGNYFYKDPKNPQLSGVIIVE